MFAQFLDIVFRSLKLDRNLYKDSRYLLWLPNFLSRMDLPVLILNKCKMHQEQKNRYIQEANLNVEQMDILIGYYSDQLKAAVESEAEVIEVEDESSWYKKEK